MGSESKRLFQLPNQGESWMSEGNGPRMGKAPARSSTR